jgi:hypothetical protein
LACKNRPIDEPIVGLGPLGKFGRMHRNTVTGVTDLVFNRPAAGR